MKSVIQRVILASLCFCFFGAFAEPAVPPFYATVMRMTPDGKLGQVIKKEQIETSLKGAQAWRVAYISSDVGGRKTIATGIVMAPIGPAPKEGRPILAWAHGTTGSAQNCGPSQITDPTRALNQYFLMTGNSCATMEFQMVKSLLMQAMSLWQPIIKASAVVANINMPWRERTVEMSLTLQGQPAL